MKSFFVLSVLAVFLAAAGASAQTPGQAELPSAPSASKYNKPAAAPPPAAPTTTPASNGAAAQQSSPAVQPAAAAQPASATAKPAPNPAPPPAAADDTKDENAPLTTIRARVDEVNVVFTVTDKHGRFIKNLTKDDFRVLDDAKPPKSIVSFRSETDLPLRVGLLVDSSNSIRDRFKFEQESAIEFLNQVIRPKSDRGFVIGFDTTPEITQDFTADTERLSRGVRMLRPGGGTAMYDAIYYACRDKLMKAPTEGPVRRAIILLSDGEDNQSRVTREEAIEMAQRAEVIVYAISTNVSGVKLRGDKVLERIAEASGGRAFFPFKVQDVSNAFAEIQDELRSQYALSYKPADFAADGRFRTIDIAAMNHKNLRVRARKGYYTPKQ